MKFLLLASFVILCTASTVYRNRNISVNDDGDILITSPSGKRVVISKQGGENGQKKIDISISGPNMVSKRIQVQDNLLDEAEIGDDNTPWSSIDNLNEETRLKRGSGRGKTQGDILSEIVREYQGVVDEPQYEKLMTRIDKAVKKGEINPQIYALLEQLDQQQQRTGVQGDEVFGQNIQDKRQTLYGGVPSGLQGRYRDDILPERRSQVFLTGQDPTQYLYNTLGSQYLTTRNVNPLLQRIYPSTQRSFIDDLLVQQQLGGVQTGLDRLGNQIVQQRILSGDLLGGNRLLTELLGYQQTPYGQQIRSDLRGVPQAYGVRQSIGQYGGIPQTITQRQQQIELQEVEQVLEQLDQEQQQLQQQQFLQQQRQQDRLQQTVAAIEKLNEVQQQEEEQIVNVVDELNEIERQETVGQLRGLRQPTVQQLYGQQQPIGQRSYGQQQQLYGQRQPIVQRLYGQQQLYGQRQPIVEQLYGQRQPMVEQLYGQRQPIEQQLYGQRQPIVQRLYGQQQLYGQRQPIVEQLYGQRQPIEQQLYGQQQQWYGQRQPLVQRLYGQQQQLYGQRQPVVEQFYGQKQPIVQELLRQQQLRSVPETLQQLVRIPQSVVPWRDIGLIGQPLYRGVQGTTTGFLNTIPQVQRVY